jgi:hypothetical protein
MRRFRCFVFFLMIGLISEGQSIVINEIQNRNYSTLEDEDLDFKDWVELKNTEDFAVNLSGYGISDDQADPFKWIFPELELAGGEYLLVFLSGKNRDNPLSELHTNFSLSTSEPLLIIQPDQEGSDIYPPVALLKDVSFGRSTDGGNLVYFVEATPGAPNLNESFIGISPPPVFNQTSGFYSEPFELSISGIDGTSIIYTLDGSDPKTENITDPEIFLYKNSYPLFIGQAFGDFLEDSLTTHLYNGSLNIVDRSEEPDKVSQKSSTVSSASYIPEAPSFKGTVVRARNTAPNMLPSEIVTRVYFVSPDAWNRYNLPVASLVINENDLFEYVRGIHTAGKEFDDWRANFPDVFPPPIWKANYGNRGIKWERAAWFDYFKMDEESHPISTEVGIRIHGAASRRFSRKSLRLYARGLYETESFNYAFFEDHFTDYFERILLKNAGSDERYANMRDALIQGLAKPMRAITFGASPTYFFINGEFYGLNILQEYPDDNYFRIRYGMEKNQLDLIKGDELAYGDNERYTEITELCATEAFQNEEEMSQFSNFVDLHSFMDVFVVNFITSNSDMFPKNTLWWRNKTPNGDDRFFSALVDQDKAIAFPTTSLMSSPEYNRVTHYLVDTEEIITPYLSCFQNAILNAPFRRDFLNRSGDALNTYFSSTRMVESIEAFQGIYTPHYNEHIDRWSGDNNIQSIAEWEAYLQEMKDFCEVRPKFHRQHLSEYFETDGTYKLALDVSDSDHGLIHLNTIEISTETEGILAPVYPWEGIYFRNVEIELTAIPVEGFLFSHWEGSISGEASTQTFTSQEDSVYIKAIFSPDSTLATIESDYFLGLSVFPNPSKGHFMVVSEINKIEGYKLYDVTGRLLEENRNANKKEVEILIEGSVGLYFLEVIGQDKSKGRLKLLKK